MNEVARKALERVLTLAENAAAKEAARQVSLRLSASSFPGYLALSSAAEKTACNADLQLAERAGAISIEWDAGAEARTHALRLVLRDGDLLAKHLGVEPRWQAVAVAHEQLSPHTDGHPILAEVLDCWRRGVTARGTNPSDTRDWLDAVAVLKECREHAGEDIPVRRLSARLFRDSKRVERLWPMLDALIHGPTLLSPQSDAEDVFSELGLVKFPPTLLMAFDGTIQTPGCVIQAVHPYLGLAPSAIEGVRFAEGVRALLSVENLTTFHELAGRQSHHADVAVVYTGGMPSPSWLRAFSKFLTALPLTGVVHHWGDVDAGGFRIAAHLAAACAKTSRRLMLHSMVPTPQASTARDHALTRAEVGQIQRLCEAWGWSREWDAVSSLPWAVEQESMALSWPSELSSPTGPTAESSH